MEQRSLGEVMTHTPGPWVISGPHTHEVLAYIGAHQDTPFTVARVFGYWDGERDSNARLIAAAPDNLEEHKHLVELVDKLLATEWARNECVDDTLCDLIMLLDEQQADSKKAIAKAEGKD